MTLRCIQTFKDVWRRDKAQAQNLGFTLTIFSLFATELKQSGFLTSVTFYLFHHSVQNHAVQLMMFVETFLRALKNHHKTKM